MTKRSKRRSAAILLAAAFLATANMSVPCGAAAKVPAYETFREAAGRAAGMEEKNAADISDTSQPEFGMTNTSDIQRLVSYATDTEIISGAGAGKTDTSAAPEEGTGEMDTGVVPEAGTGETDTSVVSEAGSEETDTNAAPGTGTDETDTEITSDTEPDNTVPDTAPETEPGGVATDFLPETEPDSAPGTDLLPGSESVQQSESGLDSEAISESESASQSESDSEWETETDPSISLFSSITDTPLGVPAGAREYGSVAIEESYARGFIVINAASKTHVEAGGAPLMTNSSGEKAYYMTNRSASESIYFHVTNGLYYKGEWYDLRGYPWCSKSYILRKSGQLAGIGDYIAGEGISDTTKAQNRDIYVRFYAYKNGQRVSGPDGVIRGTTTGWDCDKDEGWYVTSGLHQYFTSNPTYITTKEGKYYGTSNTDHDLEESTDPKYKSNGIRRTVGNTVYYFVHDAATRSREKYRRAITFTWTLSAESPLEMVYRTNGAKTGSLSYDVVNVRYHLVGEYPTGAENTSLPALFSGNTDQVARHGRYTAVSERTFDGWLFEGWYTDTSLTTKWSCPANGLTSEQNLYGRYIGLNHNVETPVKSVWIDHDTQTAKEKTLETREEPIKFSIGQTILPNDSRFFPMTLQFTDTVADCFAIVGCAVYMANGSGTFTDVSGQWSLQTDGQTVTARKQDCDVSFSGCMMSFDVHVKIKDGYDLSPYEQQLSDGLWWYVIPNTADTAMAWNATNITETRPTNSVIVKLKAEDAYGTLAITKEIDTQDIVWAHGNPTFTFKAAGTDVYGEYHEYYETVEFTKENVADGEKARLTAEIKALAGTYTVTEERTARYALAGIHSVDGGTVDGAGVTFTIPNRKEDAAPKRCATFYNVKTTDREQSHTSFVRNIIVPQ